MISIILAGFTLMCTVAAAVIIPVINTDQDSCESEEDTNE